jgi:hypothetical protein
METAKSGPDESAALISTLEGEIVPRLLMLCRSSGQSGATAGAADYADPGDVQELARLLLAHGPGLAYEFVAAVRQRGVPYDRICLELLVPAAHRLARQWECREIAYPQVAQGLSALHAVVLDIVGEAQTARRVTRGDRTTAFAPATQPWR